jgi:hypothetical protein
MLTDHLNMWNSSDIWEGLGSGRLTGGIYEVEIGSGAMMYIPSFVQIGSGIPNFL